VGDALFGALCVQLPIRRSGLRQLQTQPPGYLTESELIALMEKHGLFARLYHRVPRSPRRVNVCVCGSTAGIGTDASISTHIQNICLRNYVTVGGGRTLVPTSLGVVLVHGYHLIDSDLVLPRVRAAIEEQCALIAQGKASKTDVVSHALAMFEAKFRWFAVPPLRQPRVVQYCQLWADTSYRM
jgi:DNA topoisomerase III